MFNFLKPDLATNPSPQQIAHSFRWLGWGAFWLQAFLGFIPILVVLSTVFSRAGSPGGGLTLGIGLAILCLLALCFSIYWCYRYTKLAGRLAAQDLRPAKAQVKRDLKLGLLLNLSIMVIAVTIALARVGELTFRMLVLPQGSTVVAPTQVGTMLTQGAIITPSNMIAIQAMVSAIAAGLIGTIVSLLLIFQVGQHRSKNEF
ncbi:MAG: DUF3611 family protein [Pegethrix bostrychoides GSE-TBD4-15B]|jgi:hypothetical protein|uniref:DUF3611 family protein n=1 Tax=Pegethrix bostrychoides GSE-TBD4-15B TaxID=2839662 RepID=A0A951U6N5_9CYAN|nr:DUF3611 family protein [Pegethrix bostrychoides GSE-TBD4-15B]